MKLTREHYVKEIEGDMTPMIDCVFQLILFFILITDMSQKELEELYLPVATVADPDKPDPSELRPVVNILSNGEIWVMRKKLFDPQADDGYAALGVYLHDVARRMPQEPFDPQNPAGTKVPRNPLLIRADQSTPAKYIQKVMEVCAKRDIQIWRVELAAAEEPVEPEQE